jgi:hypothetical protein
LDEGEKEKELVETALKEYVQINDISNASQRMGYSRPAVFWEPKDKLFRAGVRLQFRYINPHFF